MIVLDPNFFKLPADARLRFQRLFRIFPGLDTETYAYRRMTNAGNRPEPVQSSSRSRKEKGAEGREPKWLLWSASRVLIN